MQYKVIMVQEWVTLKRDKSVLTQLNWVFRTQRFTKVCVRYDIWKFLKSYHDRHIQTNGSFNFWVDSQQLKYEKDKSILHMLNV